MGGGCVLGLGYVGDILVLLPVFRGMTTAISCRSFWVFLFIRKIELGGGRVVAKESHSLFGGLQLSTQAKRCEMRPHPASKKTEGEELDEGEKYMLLVNTVNGNRLNRLTWCATTKGTCILMNTVCYNY